jgi:hypothetical protein
MFAKGIKGPTNYYAFTAEIVDNGLKMLIAQNIICSLLVVCKGDSYAYKATTSRDKLQLKSLDDMKECDDEFMGTQLLILLCKLGRQLQFQ